MLQRLPVAGSKLSKILACLCEAQRTIRAAAHLVSIVAVLSVVLPETHGTNLVASSTAQREITTARTAIRRSLFCRLADVLESHGAAEWSNDGAEPPPPVTQREQAKWTTSNQPLWPKPKAGGGWLQRSGSAIQGSSIQKSPAESVRLSRDGRPCHGTQKETTDGTDGHG